MRERRGLEVPSASPEAPEGNPEAPSAPPVPHTITDEEAAARLLPGLVNVIAGPDFGGDVMQEDQEVLRRPSLPDDPDRRNEYPMAGGLLDYFPNALAEVSRLSYQATQQHHADDEMHWDRSKSRDHRSKIIRHLIDTDTVDDKGLDHWAMVCWRALAGYQEYLERKHNLPPSRASRNRDW